MNIPATTNKAYGFFGTISTAAQSDDVADLAWSIAVPTIAEATGCTLDAAALFLDSKPGRHFADDVMNAVAASDSMEECVDAAVAKWKGWKVGKSQRCEHPALPAGVDYLTGEVLIVEANQ